MLRSGSEREWQAVTSGMHLGVPFPSGCQWRSDDMCPPCLGYRGIYQMLSCLSSFSVQDSVQEYTPIIFIVDCFLNGFWRQKAKNHFKLKVLLLKLVAFYWWLVKKTKHVVVGNARHVPMLASHRDSFSGVQKWRRHQSIRYHLVVHGSWNDGFSAFFTS